MTDTINLYSKEQTDAKFAQTADLATVATTGSYDDLTDRPTIPAAQVQADWGQADSDAVDYIKNKPTIPTITQQTGYWEFTF